MTRRPAHSLARQLAALSIAVTAGVLSAGPSLLRLRPELVAEAVDVVEAELSPEEKARVYALLAHDPRVLVRARVADAVASLYPAFAAEAQTVLQELARDATVAVRSAAARGLGALLGKASFIHRLEIACQWATSPNAAERAAVAEALDSRMIVPMADLIVEQLAGDSDASVRLAAAHTAGQRYHENPRAYALVLAALTRDDDEDVRRVANVLSEQLS